MSNLVSIKTALLANAAALTVKSGSTFQVTDIKGDQAFNVGKGGVLNVTKSTGANAFYLEGTASDYKVKATSGTVTLADNFGGKLVVNSTTTPQSLVFADGSAVLYTSGKLVNLGSQALKSVLGPISTSLTGATSAGHFQNLLTTFSSGTSSSYTDVVGKNAVNIDLGAIVKVSSLKDSNSFYLAGNISDYLISSKSNVITLKDNQNGLLSFTLGKASQTFIFGDGSADLTLSGKKIQLGEQVLTATPSKITTPLDSKTQSHTSFGNDDLLILNSPVSQSIAEDALSNSLSGHLSVTSSGKAGLFYQVVDGVLQNGQYSLVGHYGSLSLNGSTGLYTYTLDNNAASTNALQTGDRKSVV